MRFLVMTVTLAAMLVASCRSTSAARDARVATIQVEVLGFEDCPHTAEFLKRVQRAAANIAGARVVYVDQSTLALTDLRRGYPAPTALVHGRDLFGLAAPTVASLGCRVYPDGLPDEAAIAAALCMSVDP
jgi:hypothetical protein